MSKKLELPPNGTGPFSPFVDVPGSEYEKAVKYPRIEDDVRDLAGRILTVIDASVPSESQNKAMKDIVKSEIRSFLLRYQNYCYDGKLGHSVSI